MQHLQYKVMSSVVQSKALQFQNQALAELLCNPGLSCNNAEDY